MIVQSAEDEYSKSNLGKYFELCTIILSMNRYGGYDSIAKANIIKVLHAC